MEIDKVISALNSQLRMDILKVLVTTPKTVSEVLEDLRKKGIDITYRETAYRAIEKLVDSGLAQKFYEKQKGICYRLSTRQIEIKIDNDSITIILLDSED